MESLQKSLATSGMVRSHDGQVIGGVCAGLAKKFGTDPWAMRLLVLVTLVVIPGSQLLLYPIAWVLMPDEEQAARLLGQPISSGQPPYSQQGQSPDQPRYEEPARYEDQPQYPQTR